MIAEGLLLRHEYAPCTISQQSSSHPRLSDFESSLDSQISFETTPKWFAGIRMCSGQDVLHSKISSSNALKGNSFLNLRARHLQALLRGRFTRPETV